MKITEAPQHRDGYFQARPGDVIVRHDLLIIDVREEKELLDGWGHIHGVTHRASDAVKAEGLPGVSLDRAVVLVCDNGHRSMGCCKALVGFGFTEVYHLVGGMLRWTAEERPVARVKTWKVFGA